MNNDFLSQDEIDALLKGDDSTSNPSNEVLDSAFQGINSTENNEDLDSDEYLSSFDRDAIGEIGNITFGTAATTLSTLLRHKVNITTPVVKVIRNEEIKRTLPVPQVVADVGYTEGFTGSNVLAISARDAQIIADLMLGGDGTADFDELNELHISAVGEAMNQMMGSAATSMSTMFNMTVNISPPSVRVIDLASEEDNLFIPTPDVLVEVSFQLQVGDLIDSYIMQLFPIEFAHLLVDKLMNASGNVKQAINVSQPSTPYANVSVDPTASYNTTESSRTAMHNSLPPSGANKVNERMMPTPMVEKAVFTSFDDNLDTHAGRNLDLLLDIPLGVTVELGRTKRLIKDVLDLAPGAIIELDKLAGEPVDILVNQKLIARGEVVVIEENFGVRVTDIISPTERVKRLQ